MSDELKKAFNEMKADLGAVKERLGNAESGLGEVRAAVAQVQERLGGVEGALHAAGTRFDTFLVRFDEVADTLVRHDTEQLQRVAAVERDTDALKEQWRAVAARVEALEQKAGQGAARSDKQARAEDARAFLLALR